jgi:hypothetical protein
MRDRKYDEITHMTAAGNRSEAWTYGPPTMMHFGTQGRVCRTVDISTWAPDDPGERGLVYCADGHCVVVWTVCRNLSQIKRLGPVAPPQRVDAPPIERTGGLDAPFEPRTFNAGVVQPEPLRFQPLDMTAEFAFVEPTPEPERITAEQPWYEWRQWLPLFGPVPQRTFVPVGDLPMVQPPIFAPVPGITPIAPMVPPIFVERAPGESGVPGVGVPVAPVPEPGTWALMLGGLVWVWFAVSRRRGKS